MANALRRVAWALTLVPIDDGWVNRMNMRSNVLYGLETRCMACLFRSLLGVAQASRNDYDHAARLASTSPVSTPAALRGFV